ncbi:hypothetical protein E2562_028747 [Oryza meyeriana var. granulata]|uniref:Uncharacterized protein n=1 Tax=Oryza meyeriana var. granulata TaxID=110450 RepID=A0A6G1D8Y0_9ORYZ|nr:hypothetical protein E2562_028747 [Oryza meyeriana var. granulata]
MSSTTDEQLRSYVIAVEVAVDNGADSPPVPPLVEAKLRAGRPAKYSLGGQSDRCCDTYSLCLEKTNMDFDKLPSEKCGRDKTAPVLDGNDEQMLRRNMQSL